MQFFSQVNEYADEMRRKNKKEADINSACKLFTQIQKVIESKQLGPTVRTQYMRTAFQIPFDSSVRSRTISTILLVVLFSVMILNICCMCNQVRISLDTNLAMVREDTCGYARCCRRVSILNYFFIPRVMCFMSFYSCSTITEHWRRDERLLLRACEHTHFPHAILEVKLQGEVENPAQWVKDLLESGMCTEVYKFSKFIHGSAVLLTELVAAAPYWIDDISIRDSVNASAPTAANMVCLLCSSPILEQLSDFSCA